jgi:hypothetical protein
MEHPAGFARVKGETGSRSGFFPALYQEKNERVRISGKNGFIVFSGP